MTSNVCIDCTLTAPSGILGLSPDAHGLEQTSYGGLVESPRVIGATATQVTDFVQLEYTNPLDCRAMKVLALYEGSVHVVLDETYITATMRTAIAGAVVGTADLLVGGFDSRMITGATRYGDHWTVPRIYSIPAAASVTFGTHTFCTREDGASAYADNGGSRITLVELSA